jgi:hypothetical protein
MDHIPCHREAWRHLLDVEYTPDSYGFQGLEDLSDEELIHVRTYIGRELSERELQRREQEEQPTPA